jgi:hypothetical protein
MAGGDRLGWPHVVKNALRQLSAYGDYTREIPLLSQLCSKKTLVAQQ